jgi:hypothetical protein
MSRNLIIVPRIILRYRIGRPITCPKTLLTGAVAKIKTRHARGIDLIRPSRRALLHPERIDKQMSENDVIANQKSILKNQNEIIANQTKIKSNQEAIKKNQATILRNQGSLNTILKNQKQILALLKK